MARTAAIDGEAMGAGGVQAVDAGLRALPRLTDFASSPQTRGVLAFATLISLAVHAAIVAAAALSLGAKPPSGEPDAIAVELVAATGGAATTPETDAALARATRPPRDDAFAAPTTTPPTAPADAAKTEAAKSAETIAPPAEAPPQPADPNPAPPPVPPQSQAAADEPPTAPATPPDAETQVAPALTVAPDAVAAAALVAPTRDAKPPDAPRTTAEPAEADLTTPRANPKPSAPRPTADAPTKAPQSAAQSKSAAAARAAGPPQARGAAEVAAYRNALLARIWGAARYPESARERGAIGVATVRFALDDVGAVTLADLGQSSGDRALDEEAVAAVRRASPLPAPPPGAPRAYSAPIRFELR